MLPRFPLAVPVVLLLAACTLKVGDLGELTTGDSTGDDTGAPATTTAIDVMTSEPTGGETDDATTTGETGETGDETTTGALGPIEGVDILFVIDNSGSMAAHQKRLSTAIPALVAPLSAAGLDLRIAVTTTDAGNPRCPSAVTKPEAGALQARSCREGISEGEWLVGQDDLSANCLDSCPHETITFAPTATEDDPQPAVRPWIEWIDGAGNVDVPLNEALACVLPQGVAGCGFESPLESMYLALSRTQDPADPGYGFLRTNADLLVVIVSDETDCSSAPGGAEIFTDNKVFWNDPGDPVPTSALCWNAGMQCSGGPGTYDDCVATDHDLSGAVTDDSNQAVLHPVSRYQGMLSTILAGKAQAGSKARVHLAAIAGVPVGYPGNPLVFADGEPEVQANFGIGPGCESADALAVPPGRIRELVEQTAPLGPGLFSICAPSFESSLASLADGLLEK